MKKQPQADASKVRMLPPLENLTLEDWAKICAKVDAKYASVSLEQQEAAQ